VGGLWRAVKSSQSEAIDPERDHFVYRLILPAEKSRNLAAFPKFSTSSMSTDVTYSNRLYTASMPVKPDMTRFNTILQDTSR
jgi:hypothetical protein